LQLCSAFHRSLFQMENQRCFLLSCLLFWFQWSRMPLKIIKDISMTKKKTRQLWAGIILRQECMKTPSGKSWNVVTSSKWKKTNSSLLIWSSWKLVLRIIPVMLKLRVWMEKPIWKLSLLTKISLKSLLLMNRFQLSLEILNAKNQIRFCTHSLEISTWMA